MAAEWAETLISSDMDILAAGRPYALPVDLLGELYGPLFYGDYSGVRKLYACSLELVEELCDETRFAKNLTGTLARVRALADEGVKVNVTAILTLEQVAETVDALHADVPAVVSVLDRKSVV